CRPARAGRRAARSARHLGPRGEERRALRERRLCAEEPEARRARAAASGACRGVAQALRARSGGARRGGDPRGRRGRLLLRGGGASWLDVRYPSEYQHDKLPGAINVPLAEVRNMFAVLDRSREYVAYCQSGRRSAAAAFLFAQRGFRVWLLEGGLKQAAERRP